MSMSNEFFGDLSDARLSLMQTYNELRSITEKIAFCENIKCLLCEMELLARYNKTLGGSEE